MIIETPIFDSLNADFEAEHGSLPFVVRYVKDGGNEHTMQVIEDECGILPMFEDFETIFDDMYLAFGVTAEELAEQEDQDAAQDDDGDSADVPLADPEPESQEATKSIRSRKKAPSLTAKAAKGS